MMGFAALNPSYSGRLPSTSRRSGGSSLWRSPPSDANTASPSRAPADCAAGLADCGSRHAHTVDPRPTRATGKADLRDRVVRLRHRRGRECLRRCRDGEGKASDGDQPDHAFLLASTPHL